MLSAAPNARCLAPTDLSRALTTLKSYLAGAELSKVEDSLRSNARKSPECRERVIQVLITAMAQSDREVQVDGVPFGDSQTYFLWRNGSNLLAEFRATEALDLLVKNLDVNDGLSVSLSHYPAVDAVIRMGQPAIPKLEAVLKDNAQPYMRKFAIFCIGYIGGPKARNALTRALPRETDPCVSKFIRTSLELLSDTDHPNHIVPGEAKWYSAFYCTGI
jgi:hypothetical protein